MIATNILSTATRAHGPLQHIASWVSQSVTPAIVASSILLAMSGAVRGELPDYVPHAHLRDDASLRAVRLVDADRGWAVGDRGVILHTETGGDSWSFQNSGTTDGLLDIAAADTRHAIAVGGRYEPETQLSRGVVLITRDAGQTWQRVETDLPRLVSVRIDRSGQAIAVGDFSGAHLTSAFSSRDGGQSWQPIVDASLGPLVDAAGVPGGALNYLDPRGVLLQQPRPGAQPVAVHGDRRLRCVAGDGPLRIAVGDAAAILISRDAGRSWQDLPTEHRASDREHAGPQTLRAACEAGGTLWAAGIPGDTIWKITSDGIAQRLPTPCHTPLHDIFFLDQQRGWAVGAFGVILATRDGGRSWRFQQAAPRRAALLVVAEDGTSLPWPVLASESLEMGRRVAVVVRRQAPSAADPLAAQPDAVIAQAASQMGGGEMLGWPAADADDVRQDRQDEAAVAGQVLDTYRPSVLLISGTLPAGVRQQWIQTAMQRNVGRVLETSRGPTGELTVHASAVLPRTGVITGDLWRDAVAIACPGTPIPEKLFLRRCYDSILSLQSGHVDGLFAGLPVGDAASSRPPADPASRRHLQILTARTNERALIDRMLSDGDGRGSYRARLELMIDQTPADNRSRLLRAVLARCRQNHAVDLYRQTLAVAAMQLADAPLGRLASLRAAAIEQSDEWRRMHFAVADGGTVDGGYASAAAPVRLSPFESSDSTVQHVQMAAAIEMTADLRPILRPQNVQTPHPQPAERERSEVALAWDFDPRVLIIRAASERHAAGGSHAAAGGTVDPATESAPPHLQRLLGAPVAAAWLPLSPLRPLDHPGLPVQRTVQRPLLDGKLDEPCWTQAAVWRTAAGFDVRLAYDAGYVYWSASGPLDESSPSSESSAGRRRDADLSGDLRVGLQLDIDGDLTTSFSLEVNDRGQTRDTCDGFPQWQPMWFVATDREAQQWTVEAAVRRSHLQPLPLLAGNRWRIRFDVWQPHQQQPADVLPLADGWQVVTFRN